jgi:hypothetical protein
MAGYYAYLLASLPMLSFVGKPPISFEGLLAACRGLISDKEQALLERVGSGAPLPEEGRPAVLAEWMSFERRLGNELVRVRAARKKTDAAKHLYPPAETDVGLARLAAQAGRTADILEAERILDAARWEWLENRSLGHVFDAEALLLYALKLLVCERWQRVRAADKEKMLEGAGV